MGQANHSDHSVRNPGPFATPGGIKTLLTVFALIGIAAFAGGLASDPQRTWFSFVLNHFFFMSLALGGAFFASVQWITGAMWSAPIRRVSESFTSYLPVAVVTFAALWFGLHHLYHWTHEDIVKSDLVLQGKAAYLNPTFFMIRNLVVLSFLTFFTRKMIGNSLAQDRNGDPTFTAKNKGLSPAFLMIFAFGFTMTSFDTLMSLDPHWFSTMFGVYCFAGLFYSVLAATTLVTIWLKRAGALEGIVNDNHLHDLGKFMFAFTVFWAYIGFSQFMLIWYANLPEETRYFLLRFNGKWFYVSIFLLVGKFMTPFFFLLPRAAKRSEKTLTGVAIFMLVAQWIDMLWISQPELGASHNGPTFTWIEPAITLGFLGVFGLCVARFLAKNNVVAIGDPRLAESVHHHHQ